MRVLPAQNVQLSGKRGAWSKDSHGAGGCSTDQQSPTVINQPEKQLDDAKPLDT